MTKRRVHLWYERPDGRTEVMDIPDDVYDDEDYLDEWVRDNAPIGVGMVAEWDFVGD